MATGKEFNIVTTFTSIDKVTATVDKMMAKFKQLETMLNGINTSFSKYASVLSNIPKNFIKIDNSTKNVTQNITKNDNSVKNVTQTTNKYDSALKNITPDIDKVTESVKKKTKAVDDLHPRLSRYVNGLGGVAVKLNSLTAGFSLAMTGVKQFTSFLGDAVKGAGNIEVALQKVSNITGKAGQDLLEMKQIAIDVGEATKFTTADMLEAQKNLGQMGLISTNTTTEEIRKMTEAVGFYAVATDKTIQDSAADIGALNAALGEPVKEIADKMFYLANTTQISYEEMKNFAKYGTLVKVMNQNTDSLFALTAAYRKVAPSTQIATTHIQSFGKALMAVHKNSKKLEEMQSIAKAIGKTDVIYDANGQMRNMVDIIDDLQQAYTQMGYTQQQVTTSLGKMFNATASNVYFGAIAEGIDNIRKTTEKIGTDSVDVVDDAAKKMGETFNGLVDRIKGKLENLQNAIGEHLLEDAKVVLSQFMDELNKIDIKPIGELIKNLIKPIFDTALVLMDQLNTTIIPIINDILTRLQPIFDLVADIVKMVLPKIAEVISKLTPLITTIADIFTTIWENISPLIDKLLTKLVPLIEVIVTLIGKIWEGIKPIVDMVLGLVVDSLSPILDDILPAIVGLIETITKLLSPIFEVIGTIINIVKPFLKMASDILSKSISGSTKFILDAVGKILELLSPLLEILNFIMKAVEKIFGWVENLFKKAGEGVKNWAEGIGKKLSPAWEEMKKKADEAWNWIGEKAKGVLNWVDNGLKSVFGEKNWNNFKKGVTDVTNTVMNSMNSFKNWVLEEDIAKASSDLMGKRYEAMYKHQEELAKKAETASKLMGERYKAMHKDFVNSVTTATLNSIDELINKLQGQITAIEGEMNTLATEMGKTYGEMYNETKKQLEKVVDIEQKMIDRRAELYNQWQEAINKATEKVFNAEQKLQEYRESWYEKQLEKIRDIEGKIADETEKIAEDMMNPYSILKSDFDAMFDDLSFKHFKDQLFNDFTDVETQITNSLDFLSKVYPKDIEKLYSQLETQVAKEQNKLFKNYLTDEELYVFGDLESRKEAIKQKYPMMYKDFEKELKDITDKVSLDYLKEKVGKVSVVDDSKIAELNKEKDELAKMNIEEDKTYQKLTKDVEKYQKELDKVSSRSFLENLQSQDKTLNKLEREYGDLTRELSFLNTQFNGLNSNFDTTNIDTYVDALDSFIKMEIDKTGLDNTQSALTEFMNAFDETTAGGKVKTLTEFQTQIGLLSDSFVKMATNKSGLETTLTGLQTLTGLLKNGKDLSGLIKVIDVKFDNQFLDSEGNVKIDDVSAIIEKLKPSSSLDNKIEAIAKMTGIDPNALAKLPIPQIESLAKVTKTSVEDNLKAEINATLKVNNADKIGEAVGEAMGNKFTETFMLKTIMALNPNFKMPVSFPDTEAYLKWLAEQFKKVMGQGATGGLIGNLASPSSSPLNSYDNTLIWANPNEFMLREKAVDKIVSQIGMSGLEKLNKTGELPQIIDYNDFFKARMKKEMENAKQTNKTTNNNDNRQTTNNNYQTTIKIDGKNKNIDNRVLKKAVERAVTQLLRRVS